MVGAELLERWQQSTHQGVMLGAPTGQKDEQGSDEQSFQSVDRLVRALQSGVRKDTLSSSRWQLAVIGQPLKREVICELLDTAYALSSQLAGLVRTSVQSSGNSSCEQAFLQAATSLPAQTKEPVKTGGRTRGSETKNWGSSSGSNSSSSSSSSNSGESQTKNVGTQRRL